MIKAGLFKSLWSDEFEWKRSNLAFRMKGHMEFPSWENWNFAHWAGTKWVLQLNHQKWLKKRKILAKQESWPSAYRTLSQIRQLGGATAIVCTQNFL